ncbi:class I SAM-dependent methyltransferase [Streptomyces aculeolatus]|uniref:class I SAM-dependent methyltransferase n=1 Tax=Streptomyces aculeolatus TaxID=270689 RepID=UPI0027E07638|nr:class I SAM-dependent methyltransferase [Streptomyces aculeolatus]
MLDLGTGTGVVARALAARGLDVLAVDPCREMLEEASRLAAADGQVIEWREGTAETLPTGLGAVRSGRHRRRLPLDGSRTGAACPGPDHRAGRVRSAAVAPLAGLPPAVVDPCPGAGPQPAPGREPARGTDRRIHATASRSRTRLP